MPNTFSRPDKLSDAETILYEIYMIRFAAKELTNGKLQDERITWILLENFLLHYRNLIEFLGKEPHYVQDTDLHVSNLWARIQAPTPPQLANIHAEGEKLCAKYERADDRISRYLAHCTTQRTRTKEWEVGTMYRDLEPLLAQIEAALPPRPHWPPETNMLILGPASNSTASSSVISLAPVDSSEAVKLKRPSN
jgi:hypothetical protein